MRTDQLDFFMSCAACLNFSLAAKYHFVSVSTLSRSISALEEELGLRLFNRGYHGHELTEAGKAFLDSSMGAALEYYNFMKKWGGSSDDNIHIGCTAYNDSFERLISAYSNAPGDYLPNKIKITLFRDADILKALDDDLVQLVLVELQGEIDFSRYKKLLFNKSGEINYFFLCKENYSDSILLKLSNL